MAWLAPGPVTSKQVDHDLSSDLPVNLELLPQLLNRDDLSLCLPGVAPGANYIRSLGAGEHADSWVGPTPEWLGHSLWEGWRWEKISHLHLKEMSPCHPTTVWKPLTEILRINLCSALVQLKALSWMCFLGPNCFISVPLILKGAAQLTRGKCWREWGWFRNELWWRQCSELVLAHLYLGHPLCLPHLSLHEMTWGRGTGLTLSEYLRLVFLP